MYNKDAVSILCIWWKRGIWMWMMDRLWWTSSSGGSCFLLFFLQSFFQGSGSLVYNEYIIKEKLPFLSHLLEQSHPRACQSDPTFLEPCDSLVSELNVQLGAFLVVLVNYTKIRTSTMSILNKIPCSFHLFKFESIDHKLMWIILILQVFFRCTCMEFFNRNQLHVLI